MGANLAIALAAGLVGFSLGRRTVPTDFDGMVTPTSMHVRSEQLQTQILQLYAEHQKAVVMLHQDIGEMKVRLESQIEAVRFQHEKDIVLLSTQIEAVANTTHHSLLKP